MSKKLTKEEEKIIDQEFVLNAQAFNAKIQARIKNSLNARYYPKNYEVNLSPTKTIPDQSMSLQTILKRYAQGLPINNGFQQKIDGSSATEGIDLRKLDLAEKEQLLQETKQYIKQTQQQLSEQQNQLNQEQPGTPTS